MEDGNLLSVVDQDSALLGSDQEMPRGNRQDRSDGAGIGTGGQNLAERSAVEGQQPVVSSRDNQLWFPRVRQDRRRQRNQRRTGKFAADHILMEQRTLRRIFLQPGGSCHIKMILKPCRLQKNRGRAYHFESGIDRRRQRAHRDEKLMLGSNILGRGAHGPRTAPYHQRSQRDRYRQANHHRRMHGYEGEPLHNSSWPGP